MDLCSAQEEIGCIYEAAFSLSYRSPLKGGIRNEIDSQLFVFDQRLETQVSLFRVAFV